MKHFAAFLIGVVYLIGACTIAYGDIVVGTDGHLIDGKIIAANDKEIVIQAPGSALADAQHIERAKAASYVYCDDHGAVIPAPADVRTKHSATQPAHWNIPKEPLAPRVIAAIAPSYYVIPLHGEVGATVLGSALEKSLADAMLRKPTVVVLDIDSPGGMVIEAEKIIQIIHHYNKKMRIVALTNQDLSAAAILSLSVKEIYVKPTSTIGAATSFIPGHPDLSAKVEEKMQSAWRAVARNSAEEGGHEPLLAEAMIDNTIDLHQETIDGKPVVKEGVGDKMLCRKGRILTLTSHEAVDCGLAAGDAEDYDSLGQALGFAKWTECKGLGTVLADYLPARSEAFQSQLKTLTLDFAFNLQSASKADPTQQNSYVVFQSAPRQPQIYNRFPGRPGMYGPPRPMIPMRGQMQMSQAHVVQTSLDTRHWKQRSLACVVAIQKAEQNLHDGVSLSEAFAQAPEVEALNDALITVGAIRSKMYEDRDKYGEGDVVTPSPVATPNPVAAPSSIPPGTPVVSVRNPVTPPPHQNPAVPQPPPANVEPSAEQTTAQLKKIGAGWQHTDAKPIDLLANIKGSSGKGADGTITLLAHGTIYTAESCQAPVTFRIVTLANRNDIHISALSSQIVLNWATNPNRFSIDGIGGRYQDATGRLPSDQWVGIEVVVHADELVVFVDGQELCRQKANFSLRNQSLSISGFSGVTKIKSVTMMK